MTCCIQCTAVRPIHVVVVFPLFLTLLAVRSRNSDRGSHRRRLSPSPSPPRLAPCLFTARRRHELCLLSSNCAYPRCIFLLSVRNNTRHICVSQRYIYTCQISFPAVRIYEAPHAKHHEHPPNYECMPSPG